MLKYVHFLELSGLDDSYHNLWIQVLILFVEVRPYLIGCSTKVSLSEVRPLVAGRIIFESFTLLQF